MLDPLLWILIIQRQICIQRPQKPKYHQFYLDPTILNIWGPPYWIRLFELWKCNFRFGFSEPKTFTQKILRDYEVFFFRNIFSTICIFSLDSEGGLNAPEFLELRTRAEILVGIQLDCDWDYLLQLGI